MTQGITTTTFGYTGDGDRLWQEVADARTTFALDLNTALPQVLGQQSPDQSTRYLPGIGQQVGAVWQYLHTDALGSVGHITGMDASVAGSWRYSPFGQIEATNGDGSLFGYTGEPQDPSSGLTYLRARYYHPALGRFLTPDAIVPDVLNGQAWNAYVYNDPINLVDPSGYQGEPPGDPLDWLERELRREARGAGRSVKDGFGRAKQWWNEEPECCTGGWLSNNQATVGGLVSTAAIGRFTKPVEATGTLVTEKREKTFGIPGLWHQPEPPETGPLDKMLHRRPPRGSAIMSERIEGRWGQRIETRWRFSRDLHIVHGMRGLGAGLTLGMLADAFLQWGRDLGACLSPKEIALRMLISGGFGLVSGLIGVGVFTGVALVGGTTLTATLAGIAASAVASNWGLVSPLPGWKEQSLNWVVR